MKIDCEYKNGMLILSALVNGYLETRRYMGFSKRDAMQNFRAAIKGLS
jgi:hypothetical protein